MDRTRRRMPCELLAGERWHSGLVLDLSANGLFVQTSAKPRPHEEIELRLTLDGAPQLLVVGVARLKRAPSNLIAVVRGGIGVRIVVAPEEYYQFLVGIVAGAASTGPLAFEPEPDDLPRYCVRVADADGTRVRRVEVCAPDEARAQELALAKCGSGWSVWHVAALSSDDAFPEDALSHGRTASPPRRSG